MLISLYLLTFQIIFSHCYDYNIFDDIEEISNMCSNRIHKQCLHSYEFSEEEIENVRIYLKNKFNGTNPVKPVCKTLHVRKNIKCMTRGEISDLIYVFRELYENGVMDRFSLIYKTYWSATHKFFEGLIWHRWYINELEKEMQKIDPEVTLPYWESISEFSSPEKSMIWDIFGHAGDEDNDYCIPDGPFAYQRVKYPNVDCVKRQWNTNQTIPVWEPPEWLTSLIQVSQTWGEFTTLFAFSAYFKTNLAIGGLHGDFSTPFASNDPLSYLYNSHADYVLLKWQLSDDKNLVPNSYDEGFRFNWETHRLYIANIENDYLNFFNDIKVKESFQLGFGELCYIHDQLIKPINDIMKNITPELPIASQRLRNSLPQNLFVTYYPKFSANTSTAFDYILPDVGNCPQDNKCKINLKISNPFNSSANGRRLLDTMRYRAGLDITPFMLEAEKLYYGFIEDLQTHDYCSPYA